MAPKDLKGAKAAIYANKTQALFFSSMGASVNPLGLPEWIPAFQTGMADVVLTAITYALPSGLTKVAPVISRVNGLRLAGPSVTLMNKARVRQAGQGSAGGAACAPASATRRRSCAARCAASKDTLFGMHEKAGGQIVDATQEQRDVWRKAMEPVYPQIVKETGGECGRLLCQAMEAGRKACTK